MPFTWRYDLVGGSRAPVTIELPFKDTETLTKGDLVNLESGEIDLAATNDSALLGSFEGAGKNYLSSESQGAVSGTDSTTWGKVVASPFAVYGVSDSSARNAGATLDISGATGAQTVATSSNADVQIVQTKVNASDETLVMIVPAEQAWNL